MIFIYWYLFIWTDVVLHWALIKSGIDPTPDSKGWKGSLAVNSWRILVFIVVGILSHCESWWLYILVGWFMFLLFFSEQLNLLRPGKGFGYLGHGTVDSVLAWFSPWLRYSILATLSAVLIYFYYA